MAVHPNVEDKVHAVAYHRFMLAVKWASLHLAALIVFLTVAFATPAGFLAGLFAGIVVLGLGIYALNHGFNHSSEHAERLPPDLPAAG